MVESRFTDLEDERMVRWLAGYVAVLLLIVVARNRPQLDGTETT